MKVSPMNKTAILSFIIDEVALKARNVSTNMRKRIHWMLKYIKITVRKYDERVIMLNGWIRVGKRGFKISKAEEIKKGVSNYILKTAEQLERVMTLNNEIRCYCLDFNPSVSIEVESIESLNIYKDNYDFYSKCSFNRVKYLTLRSLSTEQINFFLTRFKSIENLKISESSLEKMDFSRSRIKEFWFSNISFEGLVYLPREIEELFLEKCKSPNLIKAQRVNYIHLLLEGKNREEHIKLAETLKGVKMAKVDSSFQSCLIYLPSTVRRIILNGDWYKEYKLEEIVNHFPYLIETNRQFPIEAADKTRMRMLYPTITENEEKFSLRLRKVLVYSENVVQLNEHPELFEKVEHVSVTNTNKFDFDVLSSGIKRIYFWNDLNGKNYKSITLNRLEKKRD